MPLERRLQVTLHALLLLSTFLLAMGDHDSPWPMAMLGVIPLSFLFNDYLGWMRFFTRPVANWAALAGFVYFVLDFSQSNSTQYFLPVINLLLILQMVLLLHEKNRRLYWFLLMLSILEVVIAAAMNLNLLFGLLIFVYVGLAAAVLCFMSLGGETQRWSQRPAAAATEALRAGVWRPAIWAAVAASADTHPPLTLRYPVNSISPRIMPWLTRRANGSGVETWPRSWSTLCQKRA